MRPAEAVRRFVGLLLLSALQAGGAAGAVPVSSSQPPASLEGTLQGFSRVLNREVGSRPIRVLLLGDSHVASGTWPAAMARALRNRFGDGGPGYLMPWTPPRFCVRPDVRTSCTSGWVRHLPGQHPEPAGLAGLYMEADRPGETAWAQGVFQKARVYLLAQPGGGHVELLLDGQTVSRQALDSVETHVRMVPCAFDGPADSHRLGIRVCGPGRVRILGLSLEGDSGVAYGPVGVVGARMGCLLSTSPETFRELVSAESPDLVILAFGTNEALASDLEEGAYASQVGQILARLSEAAPGVSLLVLGPADCAPAARGGGRHEPPALTRVIRAQREAALRAGAAFFDLRAAMGGAGSALSMGAALIQRDGVHFTAAGYGRLAGLVSDAIEQSLSRPGSLPEATEAEVDSRPAPSSRMFAYRDASGTLVITNDPELARRERTRDGNALSGSTLPDSPRQR